MTSDSESHDRTGIQHRSDFHILMFSIYLFIDLLTAIAVQALCIRDMMAFHGIRIDIFFFNEFSMRMNHNWTSLQGTQPNSEKFEKTIILFTN